jgi:hypothetical protein
MDSLPEQHIDSLPKEAREGAYRQVGMVCVLLPKRTESELHFHALLTESRREVHFERIAQMNI